jgi:hypothetical protein
MSKSIFTDLGDYVRPAMEAPGNFLSAKDNYWFSVVDPIILEQLPKNYPTTGFSDGPRVYKHLESPRETDDIVMFNQQGKLVPSSIQTIMVTVWDLIQLYTQGKGPLNIVKNFGQENLNMAFLAVMHKGIFPIYLECLKRNVDPAFPFHLHASVFPRVYKPGRQHLWLT